MPYLLIPFDFIRVLSVFTMVDFVAVIYFLILLLQSKIKNFFYYVLIFFSILVFYILISGLIAGLTLLENVKISFVFVFLMVKVYLVFHFIDKLGMHEFLRLTALGFLFLNFFLILYFIYGYGFSGSGRFSGVFGNSNGLANYALISFFLGLFITSCSHYSFNVRKFGYVLIFSSLFLGLATLSKGFFVFLTVLFILWMVLVFIRSVKLRFLFILIMSFIFLYFLDVVVGFIIVLLSKADVFLGLNLARIIELFITLSDSGFTSEIDPSRARLNDLIINQLLYDFRFFGYGYEASIFYTENLRPHNILLSSLFELGVIFFIFIIFYFLFVFYCFIFLKQSDLVGRLLVFWGIVVVLLSMKTPFYFIYAFPWMVFLMLLFKKTGVIKFDS